MLPLRPFAALVGLLLLLPPAAPAAAQDAPDPAAGLVVVHGPLAPGRARDAAKRLPAWYGDFGALAVGAGHADHVRALREAGFRVEWLRPWRADEELVVADATHAPPAGERLASHAGLTLWAVSAADAQALGERHLGCGHHGAARVSRTPQRLGPGFTALASAPEGGGVDDRIVPLVDAVSGAHIESTVATLSSLFTRRADSAQILDARDHLLAELAAIPGLDDVSTFAFDPGVAPNVVAELTGSVHPERVIVLGAHYDSINGAGAGLTAPGADDNASGSGGVLEAARVLSTLEFESTIRFVWFSAEEFGLVGAGAYADALLADPDVDPVAMLNMDMISHLEPGDTADLDFATNDTDPALTEFCRDVAQAYVPELPTVQGVLTAGTSDHAAFHARGIPSAFFFEDLDEFSSVIHTFADLLGSSANDFELAEGITRAFVASAATLAEPVDMLVEHDALADTTDASGPYVIEAQVTPLDGEPVTSVELVWSVDGGPDQVRALLPGLAPGTWVGSLPGGAPTARIEYHLLATNAAGRLEWLPEALTPGAQRFALTVGVEDMVFAPDFDAPGDGGFTHVELATQDDWQHDAPQGLAGDPSAAATGTRVWGNDLGLAGFNGEYQPDVHNRLLSPTFSTLGASDLRLDFERWLTVEDGTFDQARVLVNGSEVWSNPATPGGDQHLLDTAWTPVSLDISALADDQPSVQIVFELVSDGGLQFGGWNLDDLRVGSLEPGELAPLRADRAFHSVASGGTTQLELDAGPAFADRTVLFLLSFSGTTPGFGLGFAHVPLVPDALTSLGIDLALSGSPLVPGFFGTLSPSGTASAALALPPVPQPGLEGLALSVAAVTAQPFDWASNPVSVTLVP